jgi:DNA-binding beta-propeller fold protein YncE
MDEDLIRQILGRATADEPPLGPVVDRAVTAGLRIRRRRRVTGAVSCFAVAAVVGGVLVPVLSGKGSAPSTPMAGSSMLGTRHGAQPPPEPAPSASSGPSWGAIGMGASAAGARLFVADLNTLTELDPATGAVLHKVSLHDDPGETFLAAPGGSQIYAIDNEAGTVTPVSTATGQAGQAILAGAQLTAAVMTPAGVLYLGLTDGRVMPVETATNTVGAPIETAGVGVSSLVVTPDGRTVYAGSEGGTVVPISTATDAVGKPVQVGAALVTLAMAPDGTMVYAASSTGSITPISTATNQPGKPIAVESSPHDIAITPDGASAYVLVTGSNSAAVIPVNLATRHVSKAIPVPEGATTWVRAGPNSSTVYAGSYGGPVIPISTATNQKGPYFGQDQAVSGISIAADGQTVYACGLTGVMPVPTATDVPGRPLTGAPGACLATILVTP